MLLMVSIVVVGANASTSITWDSNGQRLYDSSGNLVTDLLPGDKTATGYLVGGLVQLINVGTIAGGGVYEGFDPAASDGCIGDDVVAATSWIGEGTPFILPANGRFTDMAAYTSISNRFVIRWFDTASPSYNTGDPTLTTVPTSGFYKYDDNGGNYYLSTSENPSDTFVMSGTWNTDTPMIPEPGTLALLGMGMLTMAARRRFRKR